MNINRRKLTISLVVTLTLSLIATSTRLKADTGGCSGGILTVPFIDVAGNPFFCQIAEAYYSGLTNGTSATTYSPSAPVPREQMAAFITRTQDSALRRGSRRAALQQFWTPLQRYDSFLGGLGVTTLQGASNIQLVASDGADLWVAGYNSGTVSRVRASDGKLLDTWNLAATALGVLVANGRVFVTGTNGNLYMIDPRTSGGSAVVVATGLGAGAEGIAFDGFNLWTANMGGSISKILAGANLPWFSFNGTYQQIVSPKGILFVEPSLWVTDPGSGNLFEMTRNGGILKTIHLGGAPQFPAFDGTNLWVPNAANNSVSVVRVSSGEVIATLTDNALDGPTCAAFDGQRILITNYTGDSVSLWNATSLTPLGAYEMGLGTVPLGACSDGINFWITLQGKNQLARF